MQSTISWSLLLPITLQILQALLLLVASMALLRKTRILSTPIGGAAYSSAIYAAILLLGVMIIVAGSTEALFKSHKALWGRDGGFWEVLLSFSNFFGVTVAGAALYLGISIIVTDVIGGGAGQEEVRDGNLPLSLIGAALSLGIALVMYAITQPVYEWLTPVVLNFR